MLKPFDLLTVKVKTGRLKNRNSFLNRKGSLSFSIITGIDGREKEVLLRSTTPTDRLKAEHERILSFLRILGRICTELEAKRDIDPSHLGYAVEFMKVFVDKIHHGKEEDLLFPMMRKAGGRRESGQVRKLMIDHIKGRSLSRDMDLAASRYGKHDRNAPPQFVERAKNYVGLLTEHIGREDKIYFPAVEKLLSERDKKKLWDSFEEFDKTMARHDGYSSVLKLLQDLGRIFPDGGEVQA